MEGCLLFSFLLFCYFFSWLFDLGNVFLSKFGRFFWGFERFRILGILNWTFIWTLKGIWVCGDTGSKLIWNFCSRNRCTYRCYSVNFYYWSPETWRLQIWLTDHVLSNKTKSLCYVCLFAQIVYCVNITKKILW